MLKDILRDAALFVDGRNFVGQTNQVTLPDIQLIVEAMRGGGMDGSIEMDMGMEPMRATFQFLTFPKEVQKLLGKRDIQVKVRGVLVSHTGEKIGATAELRGKFIGNNPGDWAKGSTANYTGTFAAHYYKLTVDGEEVHLIDVEGVKRIINGVDQLEEDRRLMGI